jgi:hypothetical protein
MKKSKFLRDTVNWKDVIPIIFSCVSLMLSSISIRQSYQANQFVKDQTTRQYFALAVSSYYMAQSPDLKAEYDTTNLENLCSRRLLLTTDYWRETKSANLSPSTRYLFLVVQNFGPGVVKDLYFSKLNWEPKENVIAPNVLAGAESIRNWLDKGDCLVLLIDVLSSYDPTKKIYEEPNIHFADISYEYSYQDLLGNDYDPSVDSIFDDSIPSIQFTK